MPFRSVVTAAGGAGSLAATAEDAARWMQAFAGGDVLTPAMQREMLADVARTSALKPRLPYGLGIQALPIAGRYALGHSGRFLGFRNVVRYLPAEGVTIAVLTNQGAKDPTKIAESLLKIVLPPLPGASPRPVGISVAPGVGPACGPFVARRRRSSSWAARSLRIRPTVTLLADHASSVSDGGDEWSA